MILNSSSSDSASSTPKHRFLPCPATGNGLIGWWIGFLVALALSMLLMAKAAEKIPIGTVYPVWTGIGAVGAVLIGIFFFGEPATFWRIFFITTLILSIVGLKILA